MRVVGTFPSWRSRSTSTQARSRVDRPGLWSMPPVSRGEDQVRRIEPEHQDPARDDRAAQAGGRSRRLCAHECGQAVCEIVTSDQSAGRTRVRPARRRTLPALAARPNRHLQRECRVSTGATRHEHACEAGAGACPLPAHQLVGSADADWPLNTVMRLFDQAELPQPSVTSAHTPEAPLIDQIWIVASCAARLPCHQAGLAQILDPAVAAKEM